MPLFAITLGFFKKHRILLALTGTLSLTYTGWTQIMNPSGDQKVSYNPAIKKCFSGGEKSPWNYCIYSSALGVNGGVAYLLHGRNGTVDIWNDDTYYTSLIQKYWADHGTLPPTVVTLSFGPTWILAPKNTASKSGLLEQFLDEVLPTIEKNIDPPTYRVLFGESMGGLNSLIVGLRSGVRSKNLFKRVISLCPPVYKESPFSSWSSIRTFLKRTGADPKAIFSVLTLAKQYVSTEQDWKVTSPIELLASTDPKTAPEFYISCGLYDKYGNFEGAEYFAQTAAKRGFKIQWRPVYGGHCAVDIASVAELLAL